MDYTNPTTSYTASLFFLMKTIVTGLTIPLIFTLGSCSLGATMPQQITSFNVGCESDDVITTNHLVALNGEETWTAECDGKTYSCTYFPEADSNCYEIRE